MELDIGSVIRQNICDGDLRLSSPVFVCREFYCREAGSTRGKLCCILGIASTRRKIPLVLFCNDIVIR